MKYWIVFLIIALISTPSVAASDEDLLPLIPRLLAKTPGLNSSSFQAERGDKEWQISFCPDNTCDVIRLPRGTPASVVGDFTLLYLYYASGYIYLKNFYRIDARPYVPAVLARYSAACPKSLELAAAACVMSDLATQYSIRISDRRFDEGHTEETIIDPKKELSEVHLRETKSWQEKAWNHNP